MALKLFTSRFELSLYTHGPSSPSKLSQRRVCFPWLRRFPSPPSVPHRCIRSVTAITLPGTTTSVMPTCHEYRPPLLYHPDHLPSSSSAPPCHLCHFPTVRLHFPKPGSAARIGLLVSDAHFYVDKRALSKRMLEAAPLEPRRLVVIV